VHVRCQRCEPILIATIPNACRRTLRPNNPLEDVAHSHVGLPRQILEAERAECAALDAESARLEAELAAATAELDAMQQASLSASIESFEGLAPLRCDWRKRCRNGYSSVVALACSLAVLEVEADSVGDERGKRPCSAMRRGCHEPSVDGNWVSSRVAAC